MKAVLSGATASKVTTPVAVLYDVSAVALVRYSTNSPDSTRPVIDQKGCEPSFTDDVSAHMPVATV